MWQAISHLHEIPQGRCFGVVGRGRALLLCRLGSEVFCVEDRCSHRDFPLHKGGLEDGEIVCPLHGATFDPKTGQATRPPAFRPLQTFPVQIDEAGTIFVFLPPPLEG